MNTLRRGGRERAFWSGTTLTSNQRFPEVADVNFGSKETVGINHSSRAHAVMIRRPVHITSPTSGQNRSTTSLPSSIEMEIFSIIAQIRIVDVENFGIMTTGKRRPDDGSGSVGFIPHWSKGCGVIGAFGELDVLQRCWMRYYRK